MENDTKIFAIIATIALVIMAFTSCLTAYSQTSIANDTCENDIVNELNDLNKYGGNIYVNYYGTGNSYVGKSYVYVSAGGVLGYDSDGIKVKGSAYDSRSNLTTYIPYDSIVMIRLNN